VTDELKKLLAEFEKELAILKGRVDGLEAKVGELEANQFSTTTKLNGIATMVIGGVSGTNRGVAGTAAPNFDQGDNITFNYDVKLNFDTSFTGKDLLRTQLRTGNAGFNSAFQPFSSPNTGLEAFTDQCLGNNSPNGCSDGVNINRLFYQFPIGENFTGTFGAKVRQDDMLALWPSAYPTDSVLDLFTYAGARGAYSLFLGAGLGLSYEKNGWSISANYVSFDTSSSDSTVGFGEDLSATVQLGYAKENWGAAIAYTYTDTTNSFPGTSEFNSVGLSAYWSPLEARWFPSISAGFSFSADGNPFAAADEDGWSWMVGLQWADAFIKGNALGMAIGSAGQTGGIFGGGFGTGGIWTDRRNAEDTLAYELWYKFQVTDNISITPAFFWVQNEPFGIFGLLGGDDNFGGLIKTTFKF